MVVHVIPAHRVVELLSVTDRELPLGRAAHRHPRADPPLITLAYAVCCDEAALRAGPRTASAGKQMAERSLLVAATELSTHYLLGDRSMATFTAFVLTDLTGSVIVHDRYHNDDSAQPGTLVHQLCCAHLLRDLADAAQVYPDAVWPTQIADALRGLIHHANPAREAGLTTIDAEIRDALPRRFRDGMLVGLSDTASHGTRPGQRTAGLLLEVLRERPEDVPRFAHDLTVPPPPTRPNATCAPARPNRRSPGG